MFPDTFHTERLLLRPIGFVDAQPIFRHYAQDAEVTRYLTWQPHSAVEQTEAYVEACMAASAERTYVIVRREQADVIGAFALRQATHFRLDYGYVLARSEWGKGLMTEALAAVVDWSLRQPGIWRIGGVCDVDNLGSARAMEKAGLTQEGVLRRWILHPNISAEPRDCFSYAKVR
jgi:[ribosomal protein S5]-alanine N-acetyltransferase